MKIIQSLSKSSIDFLINSNDIYVKDWVEIDFFNFKKFILHLCEISGIKNAPSKNIMDEIVLFTQENYSTLTFNEIKKAFNLAYSFKLNLDDESLNHFNSLNILWYSKILNAFVSKKSIALIEYKKKEREIEYEESKNVDESQINAYMANAVCVNFEKFKLTGEFTDLKNSCFNFLTRIKILGVPKELESELKEEARKRLLDNSFNNKPENVFIRSLSTLKNGIPENYVDTLANDIAVERLFEIFIENKVDLITLINSKL